jgi:hypothetical protein
MQAVMRDILLTPKREDRMGFMDKAKKLAEQAQEKLDEAQKSFNKSQDPQAPAGGGVRYDEHGRPIAEETPAAATQPPSATPAPDPTPPISDGPPAEGSPAEEAAAPPPPPKPSEGDANATPDPFKPIE